jgi:5-methylthioadenosine/S-adenosylhomocysteine deaminase
MKAYFAKHIYFDSKLMENAYLITDGGKVAGLSAEKPSCAVSEFPRAGIFPAFINTHTHLPMSFFRGIADDLKLDVWLEKHIWPLERKWLSGEFVADATKLALCELIRSGVSTCADMYFFVDELAQTFSDAGLRGVFCPGVLDFKSPHAANPKEYIEKAETLLEKYVDNPLVDIGIAPHAPYTVSPETYRLAVDFALKHDTILHTHLAETRWENDTIAERFKKRPAEYLKDCGVFECKTLLAHVIHVTDEETAFLGEVKANISHCVESAFKLGSGYPDMGRLYKAGANISIGTDGAASNNDLNMLGELSSACAFHRIFSEDSPFTPEILFLCATTNGGKALYKPELGTLKSGSEADFFIYDYGETISGDPFGSMIDAGERGRISHLYVAGKPIMEDGKIITLDEEAVLDKARHYQKMITQGGRG